MLKGLRVKNSSLLYEQRDHYSKRRPKPLDPTGGYCVNHLSVKERKMKDLGFYSSSSPVGPTGLGL